MLIFKMKNGEVKHLTIFQNLIIVGVGPLGKDHGHFIKGIFPFGQNGKINLNDVYGHPKAPLSEKEYLDKFSKCCLSSTKKIDKNQVCQMIDFIFDLENKTNVIDFFKII